MKKLNKLFFTLTIVWMIVIFIFSAQSGDDSANLSGGITEAIVSFLYKDFDSFSPNKQLAILDKAHFIIRKLAHFTEYAILGIFSSLTCLTYIYDKVTDFASVKNKICMLKVISISFIFSTLYAISDEIHQGFTDNRYPSPRDVIIDSSGALTGILITCLIFYYIYTKKKRTN